MSWHEIMSDIAIIPAWEIFIVGFLCATVLWACVWAWENGRQK